MTACTWPVSEALAARMERAARSAAAFYCRRLSDQDRQDVAHDALLKSLAYLRKGGRIDNPVAWLMQAVRNGYATRCRKARRAAQVQSAPDGHGMEPACREDGWAALARDAVEASPPFSELDLNVLYGFAAGKRKRHLASDLGISVDVLDAWLKKNSRRFLFLTEQSVGTLGWAGASCP